ncbi:MAG: hypothetical protein DRO43_03260, partial [Candidatus Hecatellales archaeon]
LLRSGCAGHGQGLNVAFNHRKQLQFPSPNQNHHTTIKHIKKRQNELYEDNLKQLSIQTNLRKREKLKLAPPLI